MVIGIDASRANRKHKNGIEWYAYYLIKYFAQIDKENKYILYTDRPLEGGLVDLTKMDPSLEEYEKPKFRKGFQIIKSPHNNFQAEILNWPFPYLWTLGRLSLEMIIKKPDILFMPTSGIPLAGFKKTINTVHDVAFKREVSVYERSNLGPKERFGRRIINFLVRAFTWGKQGANTADYLDWSTEFSVKNAKKIISVSQFTKEEIIKLYDCPKEKIEVVYNGFNNSLYRKIEDKEKINKVLDKYGIEGPYLLYVGRLEKKKNTSLLIEAFAKARHFNKDIKEKLVLIGDAGFGFDEIIYAINEFNLENEVIIPGWVEEEDMPYMFNGATAFIFPSRHEGFGIPILQAFGCGVPVITSDIPVLREIGGDAALFFNYLDKDAIGRAIEKVTTNKDLREELARKGLMRAKDFSWNKCAQKTLKVIRGLQNL